MLQARAVLDSITLIQVSSATFEAAGRLNPTTLRTLDAVHVAAALALGEDLDTIVTYDDRLAQAAQLNGSPQRHLRDLQPDDNAVSTDRSRFSTRA